MIIIMDSYQREAIKCLRSYSQSALGVFSQCNSKENYLEFSKMCRRIFEMTDEMLVANCKNEQRSLDEHIDFFKERCKKDA